MTKHESKTCPHCQQHFECKTGDIHNCQCETVELMQHHRDYIAAKYNDCLCVSCIREIRSECNMLLFKQKIDNLSVRF